jgi:hypothetical protein
MDLISADDAENTRANTGPVITAIPAATIADTN